MPTNTPLDPRARRTRALLLDSFMKLKGAGTSFLSISVSEITRQAGVNRATFYAHFTDKFDLVDAWIRELFRRSLPDGFPDVPLGRDTLTVLAEVTVAFTGRYVDRRIRANQGFEPLLEAALREEVHELLRALIREASYTHPDGDTEQAARAVSWAYFGVALDRARDPEPRDAALVVDELVALGCAYLALP